jgi:hypothetical protein
MIRLQKTAKPDILVNSAAAWTKVLTDHQAAGTKPTDSEKARYRHAEVKAALLVETVEKCAYCESKLRHIA